MTDQESDPTDALMAEMTVPELREFCKEHGVSRERGASKSETAAAAVDQAADAVYEALGREVPEPGYDVRCPCGLEESRDDYDEAVAVAEEHAESCRRGRGVAGLSGLAVWSEESGARAWTVDEGALTA